MLGSLDGVLGHVLGSCLSRLILPTRVIISSHSSVTQTALCQQRRSGIRPRIFGLFASIYSHCSCVMLVFQYAKPKRIHPKVNTSVFLSVARLVPPVVLPQSLMERPHGRPRLGEKQLFLCWQQFLT